MFHTSSDFVVTLKLVFQCEKLENSAMLNIYFSLHAVKNRFETSSELEKDFPVPDPRRKAVLKNKLPLSNKKSRRGNFFSAMH